MHNTLKTKCSSGTNPAVSSHRSILPGELYEFTYEDDGLAVIVLTDKRPADDGGIGGTTLHVRPGPESSSSDAPGGRWFFHDRKPLHGTLRRYSGSVTLES